MSENVLTVEQTLKISTNIDLSGFLLRVALSFEWTGEARQKIRKCVQLASGLASGGMRRAPPALQACSVIILRKGHRS